ncbi:MAG: GAF domain-containing protein [Desulfobacterales bacterium]
MNFYYIRDHGLDGNIMTAPRQSVENKNGFELNERMKELKCLYGVFRLFDRTDGPLEKTFQKIVDLIPSGWQFPEIAGARLVIEDREYRSENFVQSDWKLTANIVVNKKTVGKVEITYAEKRPDAFKGPFLEEEIFLLNAISSLIGRSIHRKYLEEEQERLHRDLQKNYEKILSGFIPICASCKNIRDDEGHWHRVETYVQNRTNAKFSHGICPDCAKKLYPYFEAESY